MIVLDTHIWVWWANDSEGLRVQYQTLIDSHRSEGLGVSVVSCWEVCKLAEKGRLRLSTDLASWIATATSLPGVVMLPLTPQVAVESVRLPPPFHSDPADQLIVATARVMRVPLLTADHQLIEYPGVTTL